MSATSNIQWTDATWTPVKDGKLWALAINNDGSPRHPLYIPYTAQLKRWPR